MFRSNASLLCFESHFTRSWSAHQAHIVKFHPLWWAVQMFILYDFYETRNLCSTNVLQVAPAMGETCVRSSYRARNLPSKNWENTKTPLNTRSGPLAKLGTWRESRRWSIVGRMAELTSCQYLMHIENGSLRRKQRLCHQRRGISKSKLLFP